MRDGSLPTWWPRCARCQGPVERIEVTADPATPGVLTQIVRCHGKARTETLPAPRMRIRDV